MSGGASDKTEKSERCQSLEHSQQCLQVMYGDTGCRVPLSYLGYAGLSRTADLLYCHWCITKHIFCKGLWVIGFWFFFLVEANNLPPLYLSKQETQRQRKVEFIHILIIFLFFYVLLQQVFDFCYKNYIRKLTQTVVIYNV